MRQDIPSWTVVNIWNKPGFGTVWLGIHSNFSFFQFDLNLAFQFCLCVVQMKCDSLNVIYISLQWIFLVKIILKFILHVLISINQENAMLSLQGVFYSSRQMPDLQTPLESYYGLEGAGAL